MSIKILAQKLRHAAEVLEGLIGIDRPTVNETPRTAFKIRGSIRELKKLTKVKRKGRRKLHWTQRPENKAKVLEMSRRAAKTRKAAA